MIALSTVPVHVLTGSLGSGKTTLLNRALDAGFGAGTAVVVNEFGDVALDQMFLQASSEEVAVLKSGCVCCTIRTDLTSTLMGLVGMRGAASALKQVVIETSGLSDPLPILQTLRSDLRLRARFHIGRVVTVMDASHPSVVCERIESRNQIVAADAVVLTKADLADGGAVLLAERLARELNPGFELLPNDGRRLAEWLETDVGDGSRYRAVIAASTTGPPAHAVATTVIRTGAPRSWSKFAVWLTRLVFVHGDRLLRIKGVLFDRERDVWLGVHGIRRFLHPPKHLRLQSAPLWGSCLVFITEGLDPERIERSYQRFVVGEVEPVEDPAPGFVDSVSRIRLAH
jgi:G3E family GTPase